MPDTHLHPEHEKNRRFEARGHYFTQPGQGRSSDLRNVEDGGCNDRRLDALRTGDLIEGKAEWHGRRVAFKARTLFPSHHLLGWIHDFKENFHSQIMLGDGPYVRSSYFIFNALFKKPPRKLAAKVRIIEP